MNVANERRVAHYYNSCIKVRHFNVDDLELKRVLPNTHKKGARTLNPNCEGPYQIVELSHQEHTSLLISTTSSSTEHGTQKYYQ